MRDMCFFLLIYDEIYEYTYIYLNTYVLNFYRLCLSKYDIKLVHVELCCVSSDLDEIIWNYSFVQAESRMLCGHFLPGIQHSSGNTFRSISGGKYHETWVAMFNIPYMLQPKAQDFLTEIIGHDCWIGIFGISCLAHLQAVCQSILYGWAHSESQRGKQK